MDPWGVPETYRDSADVERTVPPESVQALRDLVGTPPTDLDDHAPLIVRAGAPLDVCGDVELEDGTRITLDGAGPDLPLGYHTLVTDAGTRELIVSPGRCRQPDRRAWGWAVQLYAARSARSWGIGTLADLRTLADWSAGLGAGFVLVNPVSAAAPTPSQEPSPYLPSSRRFRNPLYLQVEDVPGADLVDLEAAARAGHALNEQPTVDRDEVWRIVRPALQAIYLATAPDDTFARWRRTQGAPLQEFATWCALADEFGARWRSWPAVYRRPGIAATEFAEQRAEHVAFHAWLQWQLARQVQDVATRTTLFQDLPVGFDPDGADAWAWQDLLAFDAIVGAPPDPFNLSGQDWGFSPFVPWRLRQAGYRPFIESIRANMASGGGLRLDHVMALFRLWWIPSGWDARRGGYARYPAQDLIDLVALESVRAGALVVGEDLGTVEDGVRETMHAAGMLSYRLLWFEQEAPLQWPVQSMGAVTTHDLPTVAGLWSGADLADQRESGVAADEQTTAQLRMRLAALAGIPADATAHEAVAAAYRGLATAPCTLLTASLDDAAGAQRRPNLPGTSERANWSIPLPVSIDALPDVAAAQEIAATLDAAVRPDGA